MYIFTYLKTLPLFVGGKLISCNITQLEFTYLHKQTCSFYEKLLLVFWFSFQKVSSRVRIYTLTFIYPLQQEKHKMTQTEQNCSYFCLFFVYCLFSSSSLEFSFMHFIWKFNLYIKSTAFL